MAEDKNTSQVVREGLERACKEFSERVAAFGFQRTKRLLWNRRRPLKVDIIYFHRHGSSYGAPRNFSIDIRVHFEIRTLGDLSESGGMIGPCSDPELIRAGRYHLRFNAKSGDTYERCIEDLVRFVVERGEPWFAQFPSA